MHGFGLMCEGLEWKLETWIIFLLVPLANSDHLYCVSPSSLFPHVFLSLLCSIASPVYTFKYSIWSYLKYNSNAVFPTWVFSDSLTKSHRSLLWEGTFCVFLWRVLYSFLDFVFCPCLLFSSLFRRSSLYILHLLELEEIVIYLIGGFSKMIF